MAAKQRTVITAEGWAYLLVMLFLLAGSLLREINLLLVLFGLMAGPLILNRWIVWRTLRHVVIRRRAPGAVTAGDLLVVEIEAENPQRFGMWGIVVEDRIRPASPNPNPARASSIQPGCAFQQIPPGERRGAGYRGRIPRRGRYKLGPLRISSRFPLGLLRRTVVLEEAAWLLVYPRLGRLTPSWARWQQAALAGSAAAAKRTDSGDGDFHSLRDWRPGDSRRAVHWRTSARQDKLLVRQFQPLTCQELALALDLWLPAEPTDTDRERVERAVEFAATIASDICRRGNARLSLTIAGETVETARGDAGAGLLSRLLEMLALAEAAPHDRFGETLAQCLSQLGGGTSLVAISSRPGRPAAASGPGSRLRFVSVGEPEFAEWFLPDVPAGGNGLLAATVDAVAVGR